MKFSLAVVILLGLSTQLLSAPSVSPPPPKALTKALKIRIQHLQQRLDQRRKQDEKQLQQLQQLSREIEQSHKKFLQIQKRIRLEIGESRWRELGKRQRQLKEMEQRQQGELL